jgi:hypothetical protein
MLWERAASHSIRPGFGDGFLFPYQAAMRIATENQDFDPTPLVAFAPDDHWTDSLTPPSMSATTALLPHSFLAPRPSRRLAALCLDRGTIAFAGSMSAWLNYGSLGGHVPAWEPPFRLSAFSEELLSPGK